MNHPHLRLGVFLLCLCEMIGSCLVAKNLGEPEEFHTWIQETYNFVPHKLTSAQIAEKSKLLDAVWDRIKSDQSTLLPRLREELSRTDQPRYFYFDGSQLLLSLSHAPDDQRLAAQAMSMCDVRSVQPTQYFYAVYSLAKARQDVVDAALNIVADDKFAVIVPQHALTMGADYALIYMLNYSEPISYGPKLIARYEGERSETAKIAILTALWYSLDSSALAYIDKLSVTEIVDANLKERVAEFQKRNRLRGKGGGFTSEAKLRTKRRDALRRVSDEALSEYEDLTRGILGKMK